jgi:hypothetical protein
MNKNKIVFIDESGDEGRQKGKSSDYYIVLALIMDEELYPELLNHFKGVRGRRFNNGSEMKSSTVGHDTERRKEIIRDITSVDFELSILMVDKAKLTSPGFWYTPSFIKYLHSRLYQNIRNDYHSVHIKADNIKSKRFMDEFEAYIKKNNPRNLFSDLSFQFIDSKSDECVQAADFLAGTFRRCVEQMETDEDRGIFLSYFKERSYVEIFPYSDHSYLYEITENERNTYDMLIEHRSVEEVSRFLNTNMDSTDPAVQGQCHCLQILFSDYLINKDKNWVPANVLKEKLQEILSETISNQKLRGIIGRLRDNNVLVVSRRAGGYKLPTKEVDMYEYLNAQNMTIVPMVNRIGLTSDLIKRATGGKVNILEKEDYKNLKLFVEAMKSLRIG